MASGFRRTIRAVAWLVVSVWLVASPALPPRLKSPTRELNGAGDGRTVRVGSSPLADVSRPSRSRCTWRGCSPAKASRRPRTRPGRRWRSRSGHTRWPTRAAMGATGSTCATARTARCCVRRTPATRAAALATAGRVLTYNGRPAEVFYSASCGGRSESASAVWPAADCQPSGRRRRCARRGSAVDRRVPVAPGAAGPASCRLRWSAARRRRGRGAQFVRTRDAAPPRWACGRT